MWRCVRVLCASVASAIAADVTDAAAQDFAAQDISEIMSDWAAFSRLRANQALLFSGTDLWRSSTAVYGGLHWAPGGLNDDGIVVRLLLSRNFERYADTSSTISRVSAMAGVRVTRGAFELKLMAGPQQETADSTYAFARQQGTRLGLQAMAETWWEPTPDWLVASSWTASTLGTGYGGRLAVGVRLFDLLWSGPEVAMVTDEFSTQYRVGLHLTGLRWDELEWSAAVGCLEDSFRRRGRYGRIGLIVRH